MTDYLQIPHLQDKLDFYFKTIRKCFDTTNWPEQTIWEEKLAEKMAAREEAEAALENTEENQTE